MFHKISFGSHFKVWTAISKFGSRRHFKKSREVEEQENCFKSLKLKSFIRPLLWLKFKFIFLCKKLWYIEVCSIRRVVVEWNIYSGCVHAQHEDLNSGPNLWTVKRKGLHIKKKFIKGGVKYHSENKALARNQLPLARTE